MVITHVSTVNEAEDSCFQLGEIAKSSYMVKYSRHTRIFSKLGREGKELVARRGVDPQCLYDLI